MGANNMKALREALELVHKIYNMLSKPCIVIEEVRQECRKARAALISTPTRNCDVGTAEEQWTRLRAFCKRHKTRLRCVDCPVNGIFPKNCALIWAQMPYKEGESK